MALPFPLYADEESVWEWVEENTLWSRDEYPINKALFWAVQHDYPMLVTWLLEENGADVNLKGLCAHTPLYIARSAEMITVLLIHGADVGVSGLAVCYSLTPLMWQIWEGRVECVRRLLEDSRVIAGIETQTDRNTALHFACTIH